MRRCCAKAKEANFRLKLEVFAAYGNKCSCPSGLCGETRVEFLSVDHIVPVGQKNRGYRRSGIGLYRLLKANGFPEGFRLLCMNCNFSCGHFGYCPHERETVSTMVAV